MIIEGWNAWFSLSATLGRVPFAAVRALFFWCHQWFFRRGERFGL